MSYKLRVILFFGLMAANPAMAAEGIKTVRDAVKQISAAWDSIPDKSVDLNILRRRSQRAVKVVSRMGAAAVPDIEKALYDAQTPPQVRGVLCEALGDVSGDASMELLGKLLADPAQHRVVRAFASRAILKKKGPRSEEIIKRAIGDGSLSEGVRSELMMNAVAHGLDDVDWLGQVAEGQAIGLPVDSTTVISQDMYTLILNAQRALGTSKNPRAVEVMIAFLKKHPTNSLVIDALGEKGDLRAVPMLLECLRTPTQNLSRQDAAKALGHLHARDAVEPLIALMLHGNVADVAAAASALAEIGDRKALPAMEQFVGNLKQDPRFDAGRWVQYDHGEGPIPPVYRALERLKSK